VATNILWVFPVSLLTFYLIEISIGNRPTAEAEIAGLDLPEMGVQGYVVDASSFSTFG
jgi:Amt family ammonium transporter